MPLTDPTALCGSVTGLYVGQEGQTGSEAREAFHCTHQGIGGDRHLGHTRLSGVREHPFYPKGTTITNFRQVSIVAEEELARMAQNLRIEEVRAEWLGANILIRGLPDLTKAPPFSRLQFEGGLVLVVYGANIPCAAAGREIARHDPKAVASRFPKAAIGLRGLVGWVERPETLKNGAWVRLHRPPDSV